ncbi:MAG TPA: Zn-dependent alcohol dehydrogenase [Candidatus Dormibacteraeota bacterium]
MRAAILHQLDAPLDVTEVEIDGPRAGEVRVRVEAAGVCHSDLSIVDGRIPFPLPCVMGHEGAGVVTEVGDGVTRVREGDHVIVSWVAMCGRCFYCTHRQPQLCQSGMGAFGTMADGTTRLRLGDTALRHGLNAATFAEQTIVRETAVVPIPADVPLAVAALVGCGVTTGVGAAIRTAAVEPGERVAVIGCGGVGLSVIQACRLAGATTIIAIDPVASRRGAALRFGATHALEAGDSVRAAAKPLTDGIGPDVVFEVVGLPTLQRQAFELARPGGRVILVGVGSPHSETSFNTMFLTVAERVIRGCFYGSAYPDRDFPWILEMYRAGRLDLDALVTQTLPLERINEAFDAMRAGEQLRTVIRVATPP